MTWYINYQGLVDFDSLYAAIIDWAKNYGYMWHEPVYKHKVPSVEGAEQTFQWYMKKNVTEYIKYVIKIKGKLYEMNDIEVEKDGKKKIVTKTRMYIRISYDMPVDWQGIFSGPSGFVKRLKEWYDKALQKEIESIYGDAIHYRALNLHSMIKKILDLQSKKYNYEGYLGEG